MKYKKDSIKTIALKFLNPAMVSAILTLSQRCSFPYISIRASVLKIVMTSLNLDFMLF